MDIRKKIEQPEGRKLEFKRQFPSKADLLKTIIAFSNGAGGELIIGISDKPREIIGLDDPQEVEEKIINMVYDSIYPTLAPYISIINWGGKKVLNIQVLTGTNPPYFLKSKGLENGVFIRIGSTNRKASPQIIEELKRRVLGRSYEEEIISFLTLAALDKYALEIFMHGVHEKEISPSILTKWQILKQNNGDFFPTILSVALFGKETLADFDYMNIRLTKFNGLTLDNIEKSKEFTIPLIVNLDNLVEAAEAMLRKESVLDGLKRVERTIIPHFAIREAIINAIAHRDYSICGSTIKINIFDDRMEVISPGILFGNLDISDLGNGISESRNRKLVKILRKMGLMEELGTGIARIFSLYEERGLKKPQFMEVGQYFKIILPQKMREISISDSIFNSIKLNNGLTAKELEKTFGLHRNTILKHLKELLEENRIIKKGKGNNVSYYLKRFLTTM